MALYFDVTLDSPFGSVTTCLSWHDQHDIVAAGYSLNEGKGGIVSCYNKQTTSLVDVWSFTDNDTLFPPGVIQHSGSLIKKDVNPTTFAWHPVKKILAIGWENGEISMWNDHEKEVHAVSQLHTSAISTLVWTSNGSRLATSDKDGVFACWKIDGRGRAPHDPQFRIAFKAAITDCLCRPGAAGTGDPDLRNIADLAKAAVSGDETALDMFANYKSNATGRMKLPVGRMEGLSFYVGLANGAVHYVTDQGTESESLRLDSSTQQLLYLQENDFLVAVSANLQVVQCRVHADGKTEQMEQFKLSGVDGGARITSAGNGLIAAATSDQFLRMWDLKAGDNFALGLKESLGFAAKERMCSVSYCKARGLLAAVTDQNRIAIWKFVLGQAGKKVEAEDHWMLQPAVDLNLPCASIKWCSSSPVLAAGGAEGSFLLIEQKSKSALSVTLAAVQTGPRKITLDFIGQKPIQNTQVTGINLSPQRFGDLPLQPKNLEISFDSEIAFSGLDVSADNLVVWNGRQMLVYNFSQEKENVIGNFECDSNVNAVHDNSIFSVEKTKSSKDLPKIQVRNFQGTVKQLIPLQENEGRPCVISVTGNFMVYGTTEGFIRVFDLSRRDAKPHGKIRKLGELIPDFGSISSAACNAPGTKVAITCLKDNSTPDSKIYVYDVELDKIESFDFMTGTNDLDEFGADSGPQTDLEQSRADAALEIAGRYPISVHWDAVEGRLLCCEAQISSSALEEIKEANEKRSALSIASSSTSMPQLSVPEVMVVSLFVTQDFGLLLQDSFAKAANLENLIGLKVPYFYYQQQGSAVSASLNSPQALQAEQNFENRVISRKTMRDFVGLDNADDMSQQAMLDFSYHLTIGDMDEAFKAIKLIKGAAVWESMARMCVKTRRLDVAKVCLANMGHARGARALREAEKEPERDARVARLALELGMNDEAERLYKNCERFDLLNLFYQSTGQWGKALEIANQFDRVHLRTTFYNFAKHLEASGNVSDAITNYEKSGNHYFEVPRMLFDDTQMLETYIMKSKDRKLRKWWAQYMESTGEMETALKFYKQAADPMSLVRVYCYCGNGEKAAEVANETGDRAACYHLARQFENSNDFKQAIHFYTRAMAYGNAIRICKENGFEDQLMNLALLSNPSDMVEAAKYYEDRPDTIDKAVMLYHKAGHFSEALELAFESQQYAALELISQELDDRTDPVLLERCADFFTEHEQHDRAVAMLVAAKRYEEAIAVCYDHDVRVNEALVEKLTIPKDLFDKPSRDRLLVKLGDCCMKQAEYHLACQKYTQAGDKEKAMKALLKSGDTEKIIFFAGVSRTKSIYVMAANYLQSLDWRKDPEIMKNIISFYTKGRALDSLAGFYDACAQVEIDEYQNYDKALGALNEAFKCLTKAKMSNQDQQEIKITELKTRIALVKKFIQARRLFESDPEEGIKQCHNLLLETDLEASVRYGDVYGLLIEYYATRENYEKAYHYMQELRARMPSVALSYFVNVSTIEAVHNAVGAPMGRSTMANGDGGKLRDDSDDEVSEEIFNVGF